MAARTKAITVPPDKLLLYQRLLDSVADVESRSNFGAAYTAVNGIMYSMISKHGVVGIRLPTAERAAFMEQYGADLFRGARAGRRPGNSSQYRTTFSRTPRRCGRTWISATATR